MRNMPSINRTLASLSSTTRIFAFSMSVELIILRTGPRPGLFAWNDLLRREFQGLFQRIHELTDLDRLGEIAEEAGLQAPLDVARHGICAEGDHWDVHRCGVSTKDFEGFNAADAGEIDVHEDDVGLVGAGK